jgi:hypothetical protein
VSERETTHAMRRQSDRHSRQSCHWRLRAKESA